MKTFNVPEFYRSPLIGQVKQFRKTQDPRKKDFDPTVLTFGPVKFYIARHFGFCYGVENAIEIAFKALEENAGKNIYLLSEMIHNPDVNKDLTERGVRFLQDTHGHQLIPFNTLQSDDVVVIPAFGAPLPLLETIEKMGIDTRTYNTTCPFVERVWKKSEQIGATQHTIIIHGKYTHEETRSTFSRSMRDSAAVVVVYDLKESERLAKYMHGHGTQAEFEMEFEGKFSAGFNIHEHFKKVGVINQTTMLATETAEIASYFKSQMVIKYGEAQIKEHFADTRDTLCYATNENQDAVYGILKSDADIAIVVGGYNSSNTTHLAELCEPHFPTFFIESEKCIERLDLIRHFNFHTKTIVQSTSFLEALPQPKIALTSGASCPDSLLDAVMHRINSFYSGAAEMTAPLSTLNSSHAD